MRSVGNHTVRVRRCSQYLESSPSHYMPSVVGWPAVITRSRIYILASIVAVSRLWMSSCEQLTWTADKWSFQWNPVRISGLVRPTSASLLSYGKPGLHPRRRLREPQCSEVGHIPFLSSSRARRPSNLFLCTRVVSSACVSGNCDHYEQVSFVWC